MAAHGLVVLARRVTAAADVLVRHLHEVAGQDRLPDAVVVRVRAGLGGAVAVNGRHKRHSVPRAQVHQLVADVARRLQRTEVQVVLPAPVLVRAVVHVRVVSVEERQVVAVLVVELRLRRVGLLLSLAGADEDDGHAEQGGDGAHLVRAAELLSAGNEHLRHLRVEREVGHQLALRRQVALVGQAAQEVQQLERTHQGLGRGGVHPVEVHEVLNAQLLQLQHDGAEVRPQDLGVRLRDEVALERLLRVQPEALAGTRATGTARTLVGGGLRDGGDEKALHADTRVVHLLLREARVHHVHDAVDGHGGLRDVRRHDALAPARRRRLEDALLRLRRQGAVERDALHLGALALGAHLVALEGDAVARGLDLLLTREEEQDVTGLLVAVDLAHRADGSLKVVGLGLRRVEDVDGEHATRDVHERRGVEVVLELLRVEGGAHDDELQVRAARQDLLHQSEEGVGGQRALVRLVKDDARVARQLRVEHRFAEKHTVRHVLQHRRLARAVLETDRVPAVLAEHHVHLVRHTLRDGRRGDTTRLRARHHLVHVHLRQELRDLRRLAGAGLTDEDDHLVLLDQVAEVLLRLPHRQLLALGKDLVVAGAVAGAGEGVDSSGGGGGGGGGGGDDGGGDDDSGALLEELFINDLGTEVGGLVWGDRTALFESAREEHRRRQTLCAQYASYLESLAAPPPLAPCSLLPKSAALDNAEPPGEEAEEAAAVAAALERGPHEGDELCCICLDVLGSAQTLTLTSCVHSHHLGCLTDYAVHQVKRGVGRPCCPTCRTAIKLPWSCDDGGGGGGGGGSGSAEEDAYLNDVSMRADLDDLDTHTDLAAQLDNEWSYNMFVGGGSQLFC
eukprot:Rhum_TRINITY_DN13182_c1_g1::Rhum_TRINITY_DN13182_c1_g1_i1::g.57091::m.57091